jgi:hypothetical protein
MLAAHMLALAARMLAARMLVIIADSEKYFRDKL